MKSSVLLAKAIDYLIEDAFDAARHNEPINYRLLSDFHIACQLALLDRDRCIRKQVN